MEKFRNEFSSCWKNEDLWSQIEILLNKDNNNALTKIYETHPTLTDVEKHLLILSILDFDSMASAICLGYRNLDVLYSKRNKLKNKLGIKVSIPSYFRSISN